MNYYTHTIHFVDGYYYHGYHKHEGVDPLTDGYFGSPVTHREKWLTTMHWKEITGVFETHSEVQFAEQEAIRPVFNTDPYCLNANCNGIPTREQAVKGAKKAGKKAGARAKELKLNVCDPANQEKGRQTAKERGSGFFNPEFQQSEMMQEVRRRNGVKVSGRPEAREQLAKARENVDPVKRKILARERALKLEAEGRGLGSIPYEVRAARSSVIGKQVCSSKWMDPDYPELGTHNPGNLAKLQRRLGLPCGKENRIKVG
jgi:hypothetical protein